MESDRDRFKTRESGALLGEGSKLIGRLEVNRGLI
jgi:hypothetical protein